MNKKAILNRPVEETILVTPKGSKVPAYADPPRIDFPPVGAWERVAMSEARKKVGQDGCIWNPHMSWGIATWKAGENVDLADGYRVRLGASAGLMTDRGPVLLYFGPSHPTRPYHLTTPSGLWQSGTVLDQALQELGEEVVIRQGKRIGFWQFQGLLLAEKWVREFGKHFDLQIAEDLTLEVVLDKTPYQRLTSIYFGDEKIETIVAFEADTGAIELIVPLRTKKALPENVELLDGERTRTGEFTGRNVLCYNLTDKARSFLHALSA